MFIMSVRLSKKRVLLGAAALVVVAGIGVTGVKLLTGGDAVASAAPTSETGEVNTAKAKKASVKTAEDRVAFIELFGYEVEPEPAEVLEVIIPKEFDDIYLEYNAIQKQQGYNLEKYAGKRVKRFSYKVTNYPGAEGDIRFNMLVKGDKVIGGDVCSMDADGFMHGFDMQ